MGKMGVFMGLLFLCAGARADGSTTICRGSSFTEDGFEYENILLETRFNDNQGTFNLNADGKNSKHEYDINNRFSNLPFTGEFTKNNSGRIIRADLSGKHLPGERGIYIRLDLSRPETKSKLTLERKDGVLIKSLLSCQTRLAPVCREVRKCWRHCHPMVGCDPICDTRTVCEPQKFD